MSMNVIVLPRTTVTLTQPAPTQVEVIHVRVIRDTLVMELRVQASVFLLNNKNACQIFLSCYSQLVYI